jgi:hypothetical protein
MYRLMMDTNAFDFIYDKNLTNRVRNAVDNGKLQLFATDVQKQEIEKISSIVRKQGLKQMAEKIRVMFIETSAAVVALDKPGKKGFNGSRVGMARVVSEDDAQLLETLTKANSKHPLKNKADLLTFYTAIKENMDHLITANMDDYVIPLEFFKIQRDTKVQVIDNKDFEKLL